MGWYKRFKEGVEDKYADSQETDRVLEQLRREVGSDLYNRVKKKLNKKEVANFYKAQRGQTIKVIKQGFKEGVEHDFDLDQIDPEYQSFFRPRFYSLRHPIQSAKGYVRNKAVNYGLNELMKRIKQASQRERAGLIEDAEDQEKGKGLVELVRDISAEDLHRLSARQRARSAKAVLILILGSFLLGFSLSKMTITGYAIADNSGLFVSDISIIAILLLLIGLLFWNYANRLKK